GGRELGLWQELIEQRAPHVRAELLVEELLERERPAALRRVGRVERRLRPQALEALDDARRVVDRLAVEHQDGQRLLPRHPEHARDVEAGQERAAHVRDALPVERPARLLVEVREAKLPEDGRRHRYTLSARWSAQPLGTPAGVTIRPSGAPRLGLVGEQLKGVASVRAGETLGRVAVRIIAYVGEERRLLRPHDVPVVTIQDDRVGAYRAEVAFDVLDRGKPGRRGMKRHPDLAGRAGVHHGAECESRGAPFVPAELAGRRELDGSRDGKSVTPGLNVMTPVGASGVPPQVHTRLPRSGAARPAVT